MAEGKKSFIAYVDWKETFDSLPDDKAGQLVKHLFAYVNDEKPITSDVLINAVFANIKQTLKRDLRKYENIREKRVVAGKASADKRQQVLTSVDMCQHVNTVSDSVNVSVNDNVIVTEEKKEQLFDFKKSLLSLGIPNQIISDWLKVRSKKKAVNSETAFNAIKKQIELSGATPIDCIKKAVEKSWCGFEAEWYLNANKQNNGITGKSNQRTGERSNEYWDQQN